MRRIVNVSFTIIISLLCFFNFGLAWASEPYITAPSAVLIESETGQIIYQHRAKEKRPPASTTKIMTAILALELGDLEKPVKVSRYAANTEGSSIYLREGEVLKLKDLIKGALMNSGNDATVAIAESIGGSEEGFALLMNRKAKLIGALNTNFKNPHGLTETGHYSSAYDLALMARYAMKNAIFRKIVSTVEDTIPHPEGVRFLYNTNSLLGNYPGANGVKTGTTVAAGQCLVGSANRQGRELISVVLGSSDRFLDTKKLLDYGFNNSYAEIVKAGEEIRKVNIKNGEVQSIGVTPVRTSGFTVKMDEAEFLEKKVFLPDVVKAPIKKGQEIGKVSIFFKGKEVETVPLVSIRNVEAKPWWSKLHLGVKEVVEK
ncbi:MAG: hypothetical protein PWP31_521 [Clostridia bacterium]|nr:hypothetical protein [Clostridia bacterium]